MHVLLRAMVFSFGAHERNSTLLKNSFRRWDNQTPYAVHPIWCAMTFLQETNLPNSIDREKCALALLFHDAKEDTTLKLPKWLSFDVAEIIESMTFTGEAGSTEIEKKEIWNRPSEIRLLKLYDKVSNLLDASWMPDEKWNNQYVPYVLKLAEDVEKNYGSLNIIKIASAIAVRRERCQKK